MQTAHILVTGAFSSGKTAFIQSISEIPVVSTERQFKSEHTFVAFDFGRYTVDDELCIDLFGTPGARRFEFAWDINYTKTMLGYVVMVNSAKPETFPESKAILNLFQKSAPAPYVVAANWQNHPHARSIEELRTALEQPESVKFIPCVATETASVKMVLLGLMYEIFERLNSSFRR